MKFIKFLSDNVLFIISLFLLAFIPLYPKRPLLDIQHTWVYIRVEDFVVALVVLIWIILLFFKKVTLKTPLTIPILLFWIIGGIATLHGVLLIFPTISNVYPNVAFLSYLRKIEYMFLFFIAFSSIKDKKYINHVIATLVIVLLMVVGYGFGQKFYGFPAYLTMNEEFAKGVGIQISQLSRVPSTFAGHYDLAAYLVLVIPIFVSLIFGFKNVLIKIVLFVTASLGFVLLFMTVSRVSVFVLLLSMVMLLILQKKRFLIISLIVVNIIFLGLFPSLLQRFGDTVTEVDVLVDAQTGAALGNVKEISPETFTNQVIVKKTFENKEAVYGVDKASIEEIINASSSAVLSKSVLPQKIFLLAESNIPTGESLPQGTGYINLDLSPIKNKISYFFYKVPLKNENLSEGRIVAFQGNFLIKTAKAYDLSYTTRFQGEWPNTITAFKRNIFLGSGYGSVSLAVDNNYLRILGETGVLGFFAFLFIFVVAGIYMKNIFPYVDSPVLRSFTLGFIAGTFGLALNGFLIDVFEASKIAFTYWLLMGVTLGLIHLYKREDIDIYKSIKKTLLSTYAVVIYLGLMVGTLFSAAYTYYFVGDDFTWLRWATTCSTKVTETFQACQPLSTIANYFIQSDGFFYRPGTKIYFFFMYSAFWLNPTAYHLVSIFLHFIFAVLFFLITKKIFKNYFLSIISAILFLIISGYAEEVFWISATGHLFNAVFALFGLFSYMLWRENKKVLYLILSTISIGLSMLFHELGIVVPLLLILYDVVFIENLVIKKIFKNTTYLILLSPIIPYLGLRYIAGSHWFNGDYSYNIIKLPFNIIGNAIGYLMFALIGPASSPLYIGIRNITRDHILLTIPLFLIIVLSCIWIYRFMKNNLNIEQCKIIVFGFLFFIVSLIPFLGLGNIAPRYLYLSTAGIVILFTFFLGKVYEYLVKTNDRNIANLSMGTILVIFCCLHLFQLQKMNIDWHAAGERSQRLLVSLNENYSEGWTTEPVQLYFVDVPIKYGDAWIFPVGLKDAVWFVFRNEKIDVYQASSVEVAIDMARNAKNPHIFEFQEDGRLKEIIWKRK